MNPASTAPRSAALEAASLVWMEIAAFAAAAILYIFWTGSVPPGLSVTPEH